VEAKRTILAIVHYLCDKHKKNGDVSTPSFTKNPFGDNRIITGGRVMNMRKAAFEEEHEHDTMYDCEMDDLYPYEAEPSIWYT
jgi:hypothetical protein